PEAQHHAALALLYHVEAAEQPQAESDRDEEADAEARTAAPAEQPRQPALEVAHQLVEIRRRAAAPAPLPPGVLLAVTARHVPRHSTSTPARRRKAAFQQGPPAGAKLSEES